MAHVLYQCPRTGMKVQAWMPDEAGTTAGQAIELVSCPACTRMHFVDRETGRLLSDKTTK